jgi:hypothetical protein
MVCGTETAYFPTMGAGVQNQEIPCGLDEKPYVTLTVSNKTGKGMTHYKEESLSLDGTQS